jgi:hypothetical protein
VHFSADDLILHFVLTTQSVWAAQTVVASAQQVAVASAAHGVPQVPKRGIWHVTKPGLPQIERAAQRWTAPLQLLGIASLFASAFFTCATQLTYWPWFFPSQGHWLIASWTAQRAASQSTDPAPAAEGIKSSMAMTALASFM